MRLWREGDQSAAICENCRKRVATRYEYRDFPIDKPKEIVPDVLVGVCVECGEIASVPHQSTPRIREVRRKSVSIEARIPRHLQDAADLIASDRGLPPATFVPVLIRSYLQEAIREPGFAKIVVKAAKSVMASGKRVSRLSVRVSSDLRREADSRAKEAGLSNVSILVRGLIVAASVDHGITCPGMDIEPNEARRKLLDRLALVV